MRLVRIEPLLGVEDAPAGVKCYYCRNAQPDRRLQVAGTALDDKYHLVYVFLCKNCNHKILDGAIGRES